MSKGVASSGTSSGSLTKTNSASGSMNRLMSQAQPVRSTWGPVRVAHLMREPPSATRRLPRSPREPPRARAAGSSHVGECGADRGPGRLGELQVLRCHSQLHLLGLGAGLLGRGRFSKPNRCLAARLLDLARQPFELLAGAAIGGKGNEAVAELGNAESTQSPPEGDPRSRWFARESVGEQYPGRGGHPCKVQKLKPWLHH